GLPSTLPPKSSTAICAAVTEPWPVGVEAGPFMSVSTPILTKSSETCASAAGDDNAAAANAATMDIFLAEITKFLPLSSGPPAVLLGRERSPAIDVLAINSQSASTELIRSGAARWLPSRRCVVHHRPHDRAPTPAGFAYLAR